MYLHSVSLNQYFLESPLGAITAVVWGMSSPALYIHRLKSFPHSSLRNSSIYWMEHRCSSLKSCAVFNWVSSILPISFTASPFLSSKMTNFHVEYLPKKASSWHYTSTTVFCGWGGAFCWFFTTQSFMQVDHDVELWSPLLRPPSPMCFTCLVETCKLDFFSPSIPLLYNILPDLAAVILDLHDAFCSLMFSKKNSENFTEQLELYWDWIGSIYFYKLYWLLKTACCAGIYLGVSGWRGWEDKNACNKFPTLFVKKKKMLI